MELVSIIIPAYNEEVAIGDDLDLIKRTMDATGQPGEMKRFPPCGPWSRR